MLHKCFATIYFSFNVYFCERETKKQGCTSKSGQRFLKIAKSPISAVTSYPYEVTTAGLVLRGRQEFGRGKFMQINGLQ